MSNLIRFGDMEGKPVRWTDREAWWLPGDRWREIDTASIGMGAKELSEKEFISQFGRLQALPNTAFQETGRRSEAPA